MRLIFHLCDTMLLNRQNNDKFAAAPELEGCDDDGGDDGGDASSWRSLEMTTEDGVTEGDQGFRVTTGRRVE